MQLLRWINVGDDGCEVLGGRDIRGKQGWITVGTTSPFLSPLERWSYEGRGTDEPGGRPPATEVAQQHVSEQPSAALSSFDFPRPWPTRRDTGAYTTSGGDPLLWGLLTSSAVTILPLHALHRRSSPERCSPTTRTAGNSGVFITVTSTQKVNIDG